MKKIPAEIFSLIISHLRVYDKLECIRVCKKWYELITSTHLYEKFEISDSDNFYQALILFNKYPHIGQHVHELSIASLDVDVQVVLSLPQLFPNLRTLEWEEEPICVRFIGPPSESIYQQVLSNWQYLERIKDTPGYLYISTTLLGTYNCRNLTRLNVSFHGRYIDQDNTFVHNQFTLEALLNNIHNAPSLQSIRLSDTPFKLNDLEHMHNNLRELRKINLDGVYLHSNDELNLAGGSPAENLRSFYLTCFSKDGDDINTLPFYSTIVSWLSYIGQKYQNVEELEITLEEDMEGFNQAYNIEQHLVSMVSNMKYISSYLVGLCPLSENVLHIMDRNGMKLKEAKLVLLETEQVPQLSKLIQLSRPTSTLEYLSVNPFGVDTEVMSHALISMVNNLGHLTALCIDVITEVSILVDILQNLTVIETLAINQLHIIFEDDGDDSNYFLSKIAKPCKLKYLSIVIISGDGNHNQMDIINSLLDFTLQSSPLLQETTLVGVICLRQLGRGQLGRGQLGRGQLGRGQLGTLNLDFHQNPQMKRIFINIQGCSYYILNGIEEKWQSYVGHKGIKKDLSQEDYYSTFYTNLNFSPPVDHLRLLSDILIRPFPQIDPESNSDDDDVNNQEV